MRKLGFTLFMVFMLSASPVLAKDKDRERQRDDRSTHSDGKCKNAENCQDNDFSPDLRDSPVVVCLPSSTCNFGSDEEALPSNLDPRCVPFHCDPKPNSLVPPNPEKLVMVIQAGAAAIGKSAGEMAGAIAALPIGILL